MSDLPMNSLRLRPKTSTSRNYKNIQLHACLDEAKLYQEYAFIYPVELAIISRRASFKIILFNLLSASLREVLSCI